MTDNFAHLDVDAEEFDSAPRALRDAYKKLQKSYNEQGQQITDLRESQTASALSGVLAGFKNPERVKRDLLSDKVDPLDEGAVTKWLESNADDYARSQAPADPVNGGDDETQVADYGRINAPGQVGTPANVNQQEQVLANAPKDASPAELAAYFAKNGI